MNILAIDTSLDCCAVAVKVGDSEDSIFADSKKISEGHAEQLPKILESVLSRSGLEIREIDRLGVTIGPGSFTGMRVGIAMAKGIAFVLKVPVVGISTLEAIAGEALKTIEENPVMVIQEANRNEYYVQQFNSDGSSKTDIMVVAKDEIVGILAEEVVLAGSGVAEIEREYGAEFRLGISKSNSTPAIEIVCGLTAVSSEPHQAPAPIYVKSPDAAPKKGMAVLHA